MKISKLCSAPIYSPCSTLALLSFLGWHKIPVFPCLSIVTAELLLQDKIPGLNGTTRSNVGTLSTSAPRMSYDWKAASGLCLEKDAEICAKLLVVMLRLVEKVIFFDFFQ